MGTMGKVTSACGAATIVIALVVAFIEIQGPIRASAPPAPLAPGANALNIGIRKHAGANAVGQPAAWVPHDVIVRYRNLPQAYSCDALWYKVRDILRSAGAWRGVSITPYDCKPSTASSGRSPRLEIHFLTLRTLDPAQARWAQTRAVRKTVMLEPGSPGSLSKSDCALLVQTEEDVLSQVPSVRVVDQNLQCGDARTDETYSLALQALDPVGSHTRAVSHTPASLQREGTRHEPA